MLLGRLVWGLSRTALAGLGGDPFTLKLFLTNGFVNAVPAVALQIVVIPVLVMAVYRAFPSLRPQDKRSRPADPPTDEQV